MWNHLKELYHYRYLIFIFTARDLVARYKQTIIGLAWAILQPLFLMLVFTVIFSKFLNVSSGGIPYPVFSYIAILPWTFFNRSLTTGAQSLVNFKNIVTRIYFPREIAPLSTILSSMIDFFIGFIIFILMLVYYKIPVSGTVFYIFLLIPIQIILASGLALVLSSITILVRDLIFALPLFMQIWMYGSPVIYSVTNIQAKYKLLFYFNPLVGIIEGYRQIILYGKPPIWNYFTISAVSSVVIFFLGYKLFKKLEPIFVDLM